MMERLPGVALLEIGPAEQGLHPVVSGILGLGLEQDGQGLGRIAVVQGVLALVGQFVGRISQKKGWPAGQGQSGQPEKGKGVATVHERPPPCQATTAAAMPAWSSGANQTTSGSLRNQVSWRLA